MFVQINGTAFRELGRACKEYDKNLLKNMRKDLRKAAQPIVKEQRRTVRRLSGAPTEWRKVAARRTSMKANFSKKRAGIRILTSRHKDWGGPYARYMNRGHWRHPMMGGDYWFDQYVNKGWFDDPAKQGHKELTSAMIKVLNNTLHELARKAGRIR